MSHKSLNLGKILKFFELDQAKLTSALRSELRNEQSKTLGIKSPGGGDFHIPFWADAKLHVIGAVDLGSQVEFRVSMSKQRQRLYPALAEGFLRWLSDLERTTNQKVVWHEVSIHNHVEIEDLDLTLKVDNLLCLKVGDDKLRLVYPYFSETPLLSPKWARVGLWAMAEALPNYSPTDMEILDVLRGRSFRGLNISSQGNEEYLFSSRFKEISARWEALRPEYGL